MDIIKQEFDEMFKPWGIEFPENKLKNKESGFIEKSGWLIQFCFGEKDGKIYIDIYASNIMTNDRHFRIYEDGTGEGLPAFPEWYSYNPHDPEDKKKKEDAFNKENEKVKKLLHEKGFIVFTDGLKLGAQMRKDNRINVSGYRENQREKIIKIRNKFFNDQGGGIIGGVPTEFGLQDPWLNLWSGIADDAIVYFIANKIPWWKAKGETSPNDEPSCHLLSSQVACVNHLYFLRQRQDLATSVLRNIDKRIISAEKISDPDVTPGYVAFEIIGAKNYLNERSHTRGALSTSIDAVMVGKKENGKNVLFSIEWKYTEFYESKNLHKDNHNEMYKPLLDEENCPIKSQIVSDNNYDALYYDPFFQLMRQTLLSWKMVEAGEYNCDEYVHIHVIPEENKVLRLAIPAPKLPLAVVADGMCETWRNLLKEPDRYIVKDPKDLLQPLVNEEDTRSLLRYLEERYWNL